MRKKTIIIIVMFFVMINITSSTLLDLSIRDVELGEDIKAKTVTITLDKTESLHEWKCDYSKFGTCKLDNIKGLIVCDSKRDGNGDGYCDSGESCFILNITKEGLKKAKNIGFSNALERYDIECEIQ